MSVGSYITSNFSVDTADEIRRLGVQVDLFWEEEKKIYDNISLPAHPKILEIGSGPGFYLEKLASLFPDASFVSLENDRTFSEYQHELFTGELASRVEVVCGDILSVEGLGEFDLVVSRMVLEHLPQPEIVFQKMNAFVKVGGTFLLLDNDFSNHLRTFPRVDELDVLYSAYCSLRLAEGGNPYIGRELPRFYFQAGYKDIQFRTVSAHTYKIDKSLFLGAESSAIGITLVKQGYLDEAVFKNLIINWSKMAHDRANVMIREIYCAYGIKMETESALAAQKEGVEGVAPLKQRKPTATIDEGNIVSPASEREEQIAAVWCEYLELEKVSTEVSFFDVGGESYLIPLIIESLHERYNITIEITDFFEYPTIKSLAKYVDAGKRDNNLESATDTAARQRGVMAPKAGKNPFARLKKNKV